MNFNFNPKLEMKSIQFHWLIHTSKLAYDFKIIGTMTKLRQVSESIFATRKFMDR